MFAPADNSENNVLAFEKYITLEIIDEKIKILDAIGKNEITEKDVFTRRVDIMENLKREKKEVSSCGKKVGRNNRVHFKSKFNLITIQRKFACFASGNYLLLN